MSIAMEDDIKKWTAKRKSVLVPDIIQGKTTVAEASRAYNLPPSERRVIKGWRTPFGPILRTSGENEDS